MSDFERQPNTQYVLSLSYGKDSLACLAAIDELGLPLDRIVHVEVWATNEISADLPPMLEFKAKADRIIKERWGIEVEHVYTVNHRKQLGHQIYGTCEMDGTPPKLTYDDVFYWVRPGRKAAHPDAENKNEWIYGFPMLRSPWCCTMLKKTGIKHSLELQGEKRREFFKRGILTPGKKFNTVQYLGIACDEYDRVERNMEREGICLPLVLAGYDEDYCRKWCEQNDLLSPIYTDVTLRGGCWFCHNQGVQALRDLRHNYPEQWEQLLKWDADSPVTWKADGHTVHDYDRRFAAEDDGLFDPTIPFRWSFLDDIYGKAEEENTEE